jgi:hypothetical protein
MIETAPTPPPIQWAPPDSAAGATTVERRDHASRKQLADRVRAEFDEMPCLRLTCAQAQRLLGLRADVCERVLNELLRAGTLWRGEDDRFALRSVRS